MNNLDFVKKFIAGTKNDQLQWQDFSSLNCMRQYKEAQSYSQIFYVQRNGQFVLSTKSTQYDDYGNYVDDDYSVIILDSDFTELYKIDSDNLFDADIHESTVFYSGEDKLVLSRLFRLAERSAKKIDRLLDKISYGLNDTSDDLPF